MQSEFSCHVGLMGKYFCRICQVKGFDAGETPAPAEVGSAQSNPLRDEGPELSSAQSRAGNNSAGSDVGSDQGHHTQGQATSKKQSETLDKMVKRIKRFLEVSSSKFILKLAVHDFQ